MDHLSELDNDATLEDWDVQEAINVDSFIHTFQQNYLVNWLGNGDPGLAEEVLFERYAFFGVIDYLSKLIPGFKVEAIVNTDMSPKDITVFLSDTMKDYKR